ncbi:MAG: hypothetical protein ACK4MM_07530 [Fervidobacterium sp.]
MKGIVSILEVGLTGIILVLLFLHFFPQYSVKTNWNDVLLQKTVEDALYIIDRTNKTYDFAKNTTQFDQFMTRVFSVERTSSPIVWWKDIENLPGATDTKISYFTKAKKATIVDVVNDGGTFRVYSFTLIMGYVF